MNITVELAAQALATVFLALYFFAKLRSYFVTKNSKSTVSLDDVYLELQSLKDLIGKDVSNKDLRSTILLSRDEIKRRVEDESKTLTELLRYISTMDKALTAHILDDAKSFGSLRELIISLHNTMRNN